jgi:uncharacterized protein YkwD
MTAIAAFTSALAACEQSSTQPIPSSRAEVLADLVNQHRLSVGCDPLRWMPPVAEIAQAHSEDMVNRAFFGHTNPDGASPFDRVEAAGLSVTRVAENLAEGTSSAQAVLDGWLARSEYRAVIEDCGLTQHGVGMYQSHWTHLLRTP